MTSKEVTLDRPETFYEPEPIEGGYKLTIPDICVGEERCILAKASVPRGEKQTDIAVNAKVEFTETVEGEKDDNFEKEVIHIVTRNPSVTTPIPSIYQGLIELQRLRHLVASTLEKAQSCDMSEAKDMLEKLLITLKTSIDEYSLYEVQLAKYLVETVTEVLKGMQDGVC